MTGYRSKTPYAPRKHSESLSSKIVGKLFVFSHVPMQNIVEVAVANGSFNTLVAAVKAAGLAETLMGPGPFTVFAPTDAAFSKLPAGTVQSLLADKQKLASILTYHVLSGKVSAGDVVAANGARPATVNGQALDIVVRDGKVYVNGVNVIIADVQAPTA